MKIVYVDCLKCGSWVRRNGTHGRLPSFCADCNNAGTCSVDGCGGAHSARGYCTAHYSAWYTHGTPVPPEVNCVDCGAGMGRPQGRKERCDTCAAARNKMMTAKWHRAQTEAGRYRKERAPRSCYRCGSETPPTAREKRLCTKCAQDCARPCSEPDCDRPVRARNVCSMHYKRLMRASGAWEPEPWDDRRRNNYHKRRALKAGSSAGPAFSNATVFERDGWVCGLCDEPVPRDAVWPDPLSASLDHIVPLSRGGAHSLENSQLTHLACNVRKGAREDVSVMA